MDSEKWRWKLECTHIEWYRKDYNNNKKKVMIMDVHSLIVKNDNRNRTWNYSHMYSNTTYMYSIHIYTLDTHMYIWHALITFSSFHFADCSQFLRIKPWSQPLVASLGRTKCISALSFESSMPALPMLKLSILRVMFDQEKAGGKPS